MTLVHKRLAYLYIDVSVIIELYWIWWKSGRINDRAPIGLKGAEFMAISEARKRANRKYNEKAYDRIELKVPKGKKESLQAHAAQQDESLNGFVNRAIDETVERDNAKGAE